MIKVTTNPDGFKRLREMNEALKISAADYEGPILVELGAIHRQQQLRIFATQGTAGAGGRFAPLEKKYKARKREAFGIKKILQLSGEMKRRFTKRSDPRYFQGFRGDDTGGVFSFGARSSVAAAHRAGKPKLARRAPRAAKSATIFGGIAQKLSIRDMVSKTAAQVEEIREGVRVWYRKRVEQVFRFHARLLNNSKPRGG